MTQAPVKAQFSKGGKQAIAASNANSGGNFAKTHWFKIEKPGQSVVIRLLTECEPDENGDGGWISALQHGFIATKNAPADHEGNWPEQMPAICRHDPQFAVMNYPDCPIDLFGLKGLKDLKYKKPSVRVWALACLREEIIGTQEMVDEGTIEPVMVGKRVGHTDALREIDEVDDDGKPTGKTKSERALIVVNMATKNFFAGIEAVAGYYGMICDQDLLITRRGEGLQTEYDVVPLGRTDSLYPGTESWQRYEKAIEEQGLDLEQLVSDRASDEYYARFFDPRVEAPAKDSDKASAPEVQQATASNDAAEAELAALKEKMAKRNNRPTSTFDA